VDEEPTELYDPTSGSWSVTADFDTNRTLHTATLLLDGRTLVAGGLGPGIVSLALAQLYTPPTATVLPPTCALSASGTDASGHAFIRVAGRDILAGLQSIKVLQASNASVSLPSFPPTFRDPAVVTATRIDSHLRSALMLQVTTTTGRTLTCDPVIAQLVRAAGQPHQEVFRDLAQAESTLTLTNGKPGLEAVDVLVNGHAFHLDNLHDEQTRTLSVASAMRSGSHNTIRVIDHGPLGSSALLVISD
jgi:hypothetical protein